MLYFFIVATFLFATYAIYLLMTRKSAENRQQLEERLRRTLIYRRRVEDPEVHLAREELMSEIPWLNRVLLRVGFTLNLRKMIDQADLNLTVMRLIMFSVIAGMLGGLATSIISNSWLLVFVIGVSAASIPFLHVMMKRRKRLHKFLELLPEALDLMSRALAAGHAFTESLRMISEEMPEPVATEFRRTYEEQNLGLSIKLALDNLVQRIPLLDLRLSVTAILIQRETGGNLAEILEKVAHTIRERFRILEDLKTLTTSSRISAWILCGLPIFIALAATVLNPEYMKVLWSDPRGHKLIAVALFMQITGMLIVRKILRIKI